MNFTFDSTADACNCMLLEPSGRPAYQIDTPGSYQSIFKKRVTTVYRMDAQKPYEVGKIEWHQISKTKVEVRGRDVEMSKCGGMFDISEQFTAVNGTPYQWDTDGAFPRMINLQGNYEVASFRPNPMHPAIFAVSQEAMSFLDEVVTTYIYMEEKRRKKNRDATTNNAAAGY